MHAALYMRFVTLLQHFPCFSVSSFKSRQLTYYQVYVFLEADTLAEAARILLYLSCDVSDFLSVLQVSSKNYHKDIQIE